MMTMLVNILIFAVFLHPGSSIDFSKWLSTLDRPCATADTNLTTSSTDFDFDAELDKMAEFCMSSADHELFWGNILRHGTARIHSATLAEAAVEMIGQTEMRAALDLAPRRPWGRYYYHWRAPNATALASATTIDAYFDVREPRTKTCSLDSLFLLEQNVPPAIAYMDARFPFVRAQFKRRFTELRQLNAGVVDRQLVDRVIEDFLAIYRKVTSVFSDMLFRHYDNDFL